jgi:hypothetical protein
MQKSAGAFRCSVSPVIQARCGFDRVTTAGSLNGPLFCACRAKPSSTKNHDQDFTLFFKIPSTTTAWSISSTSLSLFSHTDERYLPSVSTVLSARHYRRYRLARNRQAREKVGKLNEQIKYALINLLNCDGVKGDDRCKKWVQNRLLDTERELHTCADTAGNLRITRQEFEDETKSDVGQGTLLA